MPRLGRRVARTAVVAGTATAVAGGVQRRQQGKYAQEDAAVQQEQRDVEPAPEAAPAVDPIERLKALAELHAQGVLTDEELAAEKAKILNA